MQLTSKWRETSQLPWKQPFPWTLSDCLTHPPSGLCGSPFFQSPKMERLPLLLSSSPVSLVSIALPASATLQPISSSLNSPRGLSHPSTPVRLILSRSSRSPLASKSRSASVSFCIHHRLYRPAQQRIHGLLRSYDPANTARDPILTPVIKIRSSTSCLGRILEPGLPSTAQSTCQCQRFRHNISQFDHGDWSIF